jgi:hypothetical protein
MRRSRCLAKAILERDLSSICAKSGEIGLFPASSMPFWNIAHVSIGLPHCSNDGQIHHTRTIWKRSGWSPVERRRSPMSVAAHPPGFIATLPSREGVTARRPLLSRILDAVAQSNRRKADREIARVIARNGGVLTDALELRPGAFPGSRP